MKKIFILAAAAVFVLGMSAPSWAVTDFSIGGAVEMETYWQSIDAGDVGEDETEFIGQVDTPKIFFKATVGDVTGYYEIGLTAFDGSITGRKAYAEWDAGTFQLLAGRTDGIVAHGFTDIRLGFDCDYGNLYHGREDQVLLTIPGETWSFRAAIQEPIRGVDFEGDDIVDATEAPIPGLAGAVDLAFSEMLPLTISGYFQTFEVVGGTLDGEDVATWAFAVNGRVNLEALYFVYQAWYAQNPSSGPFCAGPYTGAGEVAGKVEDTTSYGGFLRAVVPLETITFNVGGAMMIADYDDLNEVEDDSTRWSAYVNVVYNFTDNFYMVPEINMQDNGDDPDGVDQGSTTAFGVGFYADF